MSSVEWPSVDAHNVSLPAMATSSDLFEGELFGDELLDIYSHHDTEDINLDQHEIPCLLPQSEIKDDDHPGIIYSSSDGLGSFKHSTSFTELTKLFNPTGEATAAVDAMNMIEQSNAVTVKAQSISTTQKATNKRSSPSGSGSGSPAKRRQVSGTKKTKQTKSTANKKDNKVDDTPDPLISIDTLPDPEPVSSMIISSSAAPRSVFVSSSSLTSAATLAPQGLPSISAIKNTFSVNKITQSARASTIAASPTTIPVTAVKPTNGSVDSSNNSNAANSEADFKSIAQAAVSSLMLSVNTENTKEAVAAVAKVDTSTAHVKALTGNNWVAACSDTANAATVTSSSAASVSSTSTPLGGDSKTSNNNSNNRSRRQNLTPDERARQNRDRNREHARNTRLRKKAYVEELKRTLTELVAQRDASDVERRQATQREVEQREVRFRVIEEFLKLRGRNETNASRWTAILENGFTLTIPSASFRTMVDKPVNAYREQKLDGATEAMQDASHLSKFLQTLSKSDSSDVYTLQYECERKNFFMDECNAMLEWNARVVSTLPVENSPLVFKGTIRGHFSPASNKLISAIIAYDTGVVSAQVKADHDSDFVAGYDFVADAQVAANQADAILDSLQMPHIDNTAVPTSVSVVPSSSSSSDGSGAGEKEDCCSSSVESTTTSKVHHKAGANASSKGGSDKLPMMCVS